MGRAKSLFAAFPFLIAAIVTAARAESPETDMLLQQLNPSVSDDDQKAAIATVKNQTPSGWNVTIRGAGATFNYSEGQSDVVQKNEINLPSGGSYDIIAPKKNCATYIRVAAAVQVNNDPIRIFAKDITAENGKCLFSASFVIAPKSTVSRFENRTVYNVLELRVE